MPHPAQDRRMMFLARFEISVPDAGERYLSSILFEGIPS